jgi:hypothetical protein
MQPIEIRFRTLSGRAGWTTLIVALALMIAIGLLLAVVAIGVLIVLAPVMLAAGAIYYLSKAMGFLRYRPRKQPGIIEGEFQVLEPSKLENAPGGDSELF